MRGMYTYSFAATGVLSAKSLFVFMGAPDAAYSVYEASLTNRSNETNEQLECCFQQISAMSVGPSGTLLTAAKHSPRDSSIGSYAWANVVVPGSEPTYASNTQINLKGFPSLGGWDYSPVPETRLDVKPSGMFGLRILTAPDSAININGSVTLQEFP